VNRFFLYVLMAGWAAMFGALLYTGFLFYELTTQNEHKMYQEMQHHLRDPEWPVQHEWRE
jgi:hypothetical protein